MNLCMANYDEFRAKISQVMKLIHIKMLEYLLLKQKKAKNNFVAYSFQKIWHEHRPFAHVFHALEYFFLLKIPF